MLHRLCEPPSIPLSFSLATILPRRGTSRFRYGREPIGEPPTQCPWFTARTTGVSNPVRSPGFRVSASDGVQDLAFATGVPSDLNAFHRSTGRSRPPSPRTRPPPSQPGAAPPLPPTFQVPLPPSRPPVSAPVPRLSRGLSVTDVMARL